MLSKRSAPKHLLRFLGYARNDSERRNDKGQYERTVRGNIGYSMHHIKRKSMTYA